MIHLNNHMSAFQSYRKAYLPLLPNSLVDLSHLDVVPLDSPRKLEEALVNAFPLTAKLQLVHLVKSDVASECIPLNVGVVFSGGQAPGGNNVVAGLYDALKKNSGDSTLFGFLNGPLGLIQGKYKEIDGKLLSEYRNLGGFDLLGSDRTKIESATQAQVLANVEALKLDGLVVIGGDDSNTNAAFLAEYFLSKNNRTCVIGVPKTIDGDLKNEWIETSFGFDTATKTYADIIGNLAKDALSAKKYYFFIRLMGRTASSITLECALQTHPNYTLIGEEILAEGLLLGDIIEKIADLVCERAKASKDYGLILIPEGLLEFIPDCKALLKELSALKNIPSDEIAENLSPPSKACYLSLPETIKKQLLMDRDPHGNLQVSKIETERLLIAMVEEELTKRKDSGCYQGKFNPQPIFCGYEGRSCAPSNFDANYCYGLGHVALALIQKGLTGYMAALKKLHLPVDSWQAMGIPISSLMHFEERKGEKKAVIRKALVDLNGSPFTYFKERRDDWVMKDEYSFPGPIQYFGPYELTERITSTLALETHLVH